MKKLLITAGVLVIAASSVMAVPTAQVTLGMTRDLFFQDAAFTTPTLSGWYVEIILQQNNVAYNSANYATYTVAASDVGFYNPLQTYHETGKLANGTATSAGRSQVSWQFTVTTYDNYYASWRVYDNADKSKATKYLVVPTWKQVTLDPNEPTSTANITWSSTADRAYTKYSLTPVPEPTTMALFGLGGLALVLRRKMRKDA